jgi:hypothetical protein
MEWYRTRYLEKAPSLYLTLTSILLAIALENLVGRLEALGALSAVSGALVLSWLQASLVLQQILLIWVATALVFHSLHWTAGVEDVFMPFVSGLTLLLAIAWIGPDSLLQFFVLAVVGSFGAVLAVKAILSMAARDPENQEILANFSRLGVLGSIGGNGAIGVLAAVLLASGVEAPGPILVLLLVANGLMTWGITSWLAGWRRVLEGSEETAC